MSRVLSVTLLTDQKTRKSITLSDVTLCHCLQTSLQQVCRVLAPHAGCSEAKHPPVSNQKKKRFYICAQKYFLCQSVQNTLSWTSMSATHQIEEHFKDSKMDRGAEFRAFS